jgi:DegV family protein with EDD domain
MNVGIVTDSTCDLPAAKLLKLGVAAVPLKVSVGSETYRDWRDIEPLRLYEMMTDNGALPQTSPPDVQDFLPVYTRFLNTYQHIVSIHLSSKLSETMSRAQQAAAQLRAENRIHFVDSGAASAPLAEIVIGAATAAAANSSLSDVLDTTERVKSSIYTLITPDSLEWLRHGGQLSRVKGTFGNLFGLRPVLTLQDGSVASDGATRQNAITETFITRLKKRFGDAPIRMTLSFAGKSREEIEVIKRAIELSGLNIIKGRVQLIGPVIGAKLGPGTVAVCAYPELGAVLDI